MDVGNNIADSELARLKRLASALLAAESPELSLLDQIASLAGEVAARQREALRRELVGQVVGGVEAMFPAAAAEVHSRLADCSLDELSGLATVLDSAAAAHAAFARADADLMTARERGDYAAMSPLALEAGAQKTALAAAADEFARRLDLQEVLVPTVAVATAAPTRGPEAGEAAGEEASTGDRPGEAALEEVAAAATAEPAAAADPVPAAGPEGPGDTVVTLDLRPETQGERRRLRNLIRQMRSPSEEAPASR